MWYAPNVTFSILTIHGHFQRASSRLRAETRSSSLRRRVICSLLSQRQKSKLNSSEFYMKRNGQQSANRTPPCVEKPHTSASRSRNSEKKQVIERVI